MKQLYDVSGLADYVRNVEVLGKTFKIFAETELSYRKNEDLSYNDVLEDVIQTSLCIVSRGVAGNGNFNELQSGIQRVSRFIFSEPFHLEIAITMASKVAYIANVIKCKASEVETFETPLQVRDWNIEEPVWNRLNRFKRTNPEAFFYWYKFHELGSSE